MYIEEMQNKPDSFCLNFLLCRDLSTKFIVPPTPMTFTITIWFHFQKNSLDNFGQHPFA